MKSASLSVARAYSGLGRDEPGRGLPRISHSAWMALKPLRIRPAPGRIGLRQTVQIGLAGGFFLHDRERTRRKSPGIYFLAMVITWRLLVRAVT